MEEVKKKSQSEIPDYLAPKEGSPRMFKSPILEALSKTHPIVPPLIYFPLVSYLIWFSFRVIKFRIDTIIGLFVLGMLFWTLAEYFLHRFIFHFEPKTALEFKIQYMIHGVHHQYPKDPYRLVMPPSVSIPLAVIFWLVFRFSLGIYAYAFFPGFVFGYLIYDMMHYAIHHFKAPNGALRQIWRHHLQHHYKNPFKAFGVSSPVWDYVFRTMP